MQATPYESVTKSAGTNANRVPGQFKGSVFRIVTTNSKTPTARFPQFPH